MPKDRRNKYRVIENGVIQGAYAIYDSNRIEIGGKAYITIYPPISEQNWPTDIDNMKWSKTMINEIVEVDDTFEFVKNNPQKFYSIIVK